MDDGRIVPVERSELSRKIGSLIHAQVLMNWHLLDSLNSGGIHIVIFHHFFVPVANDSTTIQSWLTCPSTPSTSQKR